MGLLHRLQSRHRCLCRQWAVGSSEFRREQLVLRSEMTLTNLTAIIGRIGSDATRNEHPVCNYVKRTNFVIEFVFLFITLRFLFP